MREITSLDEFLRMTGKPLKLIGSTVDYHNDLSMIRRLVESGEFPADSTIDPSNQNINNQIDAADKIANILIHPQCPVGLTLNLQHTVIFFEQPEILNFEKIIMQALESGRCPYGTRIIGLGREIEALCEENDYNISHAQGKMYIGDEGAKKIAKILRSKTRHFNYPNILNFDLSKKKINDTGAKAIAETLSSGQCPANLKINLSMNFITDKGAKAIAEALESGQCPANLHIDLSNNPICPEGVQAIVKALKSGRCAYGTRIKGLGSEIEALCEENDQKILQATVKLRDIGDEGAKEVAMRIMLNENEQNGNIGSKFNLKNNGITTKGAIAIAEALEFGKYLKNLRSINLGENKKIGNDGAIAIARGLRFGKYFAKLECINLENTGIGDEGAIAIARTLTSSEYSLSLVIALGNKNISEKGKVVIVEALESGKCPCGTYITGLGEKIKALCKENDYKISHAAIRLCDTGIDDIEIKNIATTLNSNSQDFWAIPKIKAVIEKMPRFAKDFSDLKFDLRYNKISYKGAEAIADLLESGKNLKNFTIDLEGNNIGDDGAVKIVGALMSQNCPTGLTLGLSKTGISAKGAQAIAAVFASGFCPENVTIDLSHNKISGDGITAIADAFKSGHCPKHLTITLGFNGITVKDITAIAVALISPGCPEHLTINFLLYCEVYDQFFNVIVEIAEALKSGKCPYGTRITGLSGEITQDDLCEVNDRIQLAKRAAPAPQAEKPKQKPEQKPESAEPAAQQTVHTSPFGLGLFGEAPQTPKTPVRNVSKLNPGAAVFQPISKKMQ